MKKYVLALVVSVLSLSFYGYSQSEGALDFSFDPGMGLDSGSFVTTVLTSTIQSDGKIIIGGRFEEDDGVSDINNIARIKPDGSLDTTFKTGTGATNGTVQVTTIQDNGKIIFGGTYHYNGVIINSLGRLQPDGTLDSLFSQATAMSGAPRTLSVQNDGKLIVAGSFSSFNGDASINDIVRLHADGNVDTTFYAGTGVVGSVNTGIYATAIQEDGKILIGGKFTAYNGDTSVNHIARLHPDGTPDTSFIKGRGVGDDSDIPGVFSISLQNDEKIVIGGWFQEYNGEAINHIARLHPDGTLDASFDPGAGPPGGNIMHTYIQNDGKILIAGFFQASIVRLHPNGMLDATFDPGFGANDGIRTFAVQDDGKVVIGGDFTEYNGTPRNRIARIHRDTTSPTGYTTMRGQPEMSLYPNPASHTLTIAFPDYRLFGPEVQVTLYNTTGVITHRSVHRVEPDDRIKMNISHLSPGMYMAQVRESQSGEYVTKRVVVK